MRGLVIALSLTLPRLAASTELIALTDRGTLIAFPSDHPASTRALDIVPCRGQLIGVDRRASDNRLYGLTDLNEVVRLDPAEHTCTVVSALTLPFGGGTRSGIDFNPQLDRLRCLSADRQNLRVQPTLGAAALDGSLTYGPDDRHAGQRPEITGAAYTHNTANAPTTLLYEIDAATDALVIQEPANEGILKTVGPLGVDAGTATGFEIVTLADGTEQPWLALGNTLYRVDLTTGQATPVGPIGDRDIAVVSLTSAP